MSLAGVEPGLFFGSPMVALGGVVYLKFMISAHLGVSKPVVSNPWGSAACVVGDAQQSTHLLRV